MLPTVHKTRDVKDLVAHLADGSMRRLSFQRDKWQKDKGKTNDYKELIDFIQSLNREWMVAAQRLSPRILIEMTRKYDQELMALFDSLDPAGPAFFAVAWAGEEQSFNWFDIAREYTEKWHHQQQIRDATGRPALYEPFLLMPVLETFARGFPHAYRGVEAPAGAIVSVRIEGQVKCGWTLQKEDNQWSLYRGVASAPDALLRLQADQAWRLWTKGLSPNLLEHSYQAEGEQKLIVPLLNFTAIMA